MKPGGKIMSSEVDRSESDDPDVSPEAAVKRNPQNGQAENDPSLANSDVEHLSDGGANAARHTGDRDPAKGT